MSDMSIWAAQIDALAAKANFWLTVSTVAAWVGFACSIAAAVIYVITIRRERNDNYRKYISKQ